MNVDGFHQMSGFEKSKVFEVHGTIRRFRCLSCNTSIPEIVNPTVDTSTRCPKCRGYPRPDVTLFTESLPEDEWIGAVQATINLKPNDVMLVIGTSSMVYPAAGIPQMAKERGVKIIEVNPSPQEASPISRIVDVYIQGTALEALVTLVQEIENSRDNNQNAKSNY